MSVPTVQTNQAALDLLQDVALRLAALEQQFSASATAVSPPKLPLPARFSGAQNEYRGFLSQCLVHFKLNPASFPDDEAKVAFIYSLLSGQALAWATPLWEGGGPIVRDLSMFQARFRETFQGPDPEAAAGFDLLKLRQASRSVPEYAIQFRTLAEELGWGDKPLRTIFSFGLKSRIKDELAARGTPASLGELIALASSIDKRMRERDLEVLRGSRAPADFPSGVDEPEEMEISLIRHPPEPPRVHPNVACQICNHLGHLAPRCPYRWPSTSPSRDTRGSCHLPKDGSVSVGRVGVSHGPLHQASSRRRFVPPEKRGAVLSGGHRSKELGHLGVKRSVKVISQFCWWPTLRRDVRDHVRACRSCVSRRELSSSHPHPCIAPQPRVRPGGGPPTPCKTGSRGVRRQPAKVGDLVTLPLGRRRQAVSLGVPSPSLDTVSPLPVLCSKVEEVESTGTPSPVLNGIPEVLDIPDLGSRDEDVGVESHPIALEEVDVMASSVQAPYEHFLTGGGAVTSLFSQEEAGPTLPFPASTLGAEGSRDQAKEFGSIESLWGAQAHDLGDEEVGIFRVEGQSDQESPGDSDLSDIAPGFW